MEQDNTHLREKLHELREDKSHLISENHSLLSEVEKLRYELHQEVNRFHLLEEDAENCRHKSNELSMALQEVVKGNEEKLMKFDGHVQCLQQMINSLEEEIAVLSNAKRNVEGKYFYQWLKVKIIY